jgi:putative transposase
MQLCFRKRQSRGVGVVRRLPPVTRSAARPRRERPLHDALLVHIQAAYTASRRTYGAPRIHHELHAQGVAAGRHRIARVMRREGIVACTERRFRWTATARAELPAAPDRLRRDFTAAAPNQRWVADITSVRTGQGWLHLAIVLDLYARRIVGWAMAPTLDQQLPATSSSPAITPAGRRAWPINPAALTFIGNRCQRQSSPW